MFKKKQKKVTEDILEETIDDIAKNDPYDGRALKTNITATRDDLKFWTVTYMLTQERLKDGVWESRSKVVTTIDKRFDRGVAQSKVFMDKIMESCGYDLFVYFEMHPEELKENTNDTSDSKQDTNN